MRTWLRTTALLGAALLMACDGRWVEYTANVTISKDYQIREVGEFVYAGVYTLDDLADLSSEIPDGADVLEAQITFLDAEYTVLPSTTASELKIWLVLRDETNDTPILTRSKTVGNFLAGPRTILNLIPASERQAELAKLRNKINAFIQNNEQVNIGVGFGGEAIGGPFDANMTARVHMSIRYRVCEEIGSGLVDSELGDCSTVF